MTPTQEQIEEALQYCDDEMTLDETDNKRFKVLAAAYRLAVAERDRKIEGKCDWHLPSCHVFADEQARRAEQAESRLAEVEKERDDWRQRYLEARNLILNREDSKKLALASALLKAKDEALLEYGSHKSSCDIHRCQLGHPCDCGFGKALALRLDGEGK